MPSAFRIGQVVFARELRGMRESTAVEAAGGHRGGWDFSGSEV